MKRVFAVPALIAALGLAGLFSALTGNGAADWLAWAGLGAGPAAVAGARFGRRSKDRRGRRRHQGELRT